MTVTRTDDARGNVLSALDAAGAGATTPRGGAGQSTIVCAMTHAGDEVG